MKTARIQPTMTKRQTARLLRAYNRWRRSTHLQSCECPDPREIGRAIDSAIGYLERRRPTAKQN